VENLLVNSEIFLNKEDRVYSKLYTIKIEKSVENDGCCFWA
jgi:hypothetical protein